MPPFSQRLANWVSASFLAWNGMLATGFLPDTKFVHGITVGLTGVQILFTNLGFNRMPSGTVIPETVKKFVDEPHIATLRKDVTAGLVD